jgi:cbb3-type cytochrome oxidase maturation protein
MNGILLLIPIALGLGGLGVAAFFWALRSNQFDDPDGAANRILLDDDLEDHDPSGKNER